MQASNFALEMLCMGKGFVFSSLGTSKANTYAGEGEGAGQGQGDGIDEELCYSVV